MVLMTIKIYNHIHIYIYNINKYFCCCFINSYASIAVKYCKDYEFKKTRKYSLFNFNDLI